MSKHENILQSLTINATHGVNEKGEIYYTSLNTTLQTATLYVDDETNNIIKTDANPAYQQPDAVVQQYLGEQMALLVVGPIEAEKAKAKEAKDKGVADLAAEQTAHEATKADHAVTLKAATDKAQFDLAALAETHRLALEAKEAEHTAALEAERAKVAAEQQKLTDANAAHTAALAAKEAEKGALQSKLTQREQELNELGGEPLAKQRKAEREKTEKVQRAVDAVKVIHDLKLDVAAILAEATKVEVVSEAIQP